MSDNKVYQVPQAFAETAHLDAEQFRSMYRQSVEDPEGFWAEQAEKFLSWEQPWDTVLDCDFETGRVRWFEGGKLNACYNCIDRHLERRSEQTALIWEGDDPADDAQISYGELYEHVCRFANALKARNVGKGDRVCIYMPMVPEAVYAMLACARIGAVHSVVFGGFSPESIKDRILDSDCQTVITADEGVRGGKTIPLKGNVDQALQSCPNVHTVFTIRRTAGSIDWTEGRDVWYHDAVAGASVDCPVEWMDAEDPLFILYTSGSTGKPKGVLHTTGGYLVNTTLTTRHVFDLKEGDLYWCTADVGWVTGHSYIVYGPLAAGATVMMYEGAPNWPAEDRFWDIIERHQINILYTAPTAIRAFI
ncbi:MAG: AMP-binding protein, partial [Gammaproteobacteria bacterium]|nr:AMP-binding protein [Gammaproteobacteria bacterium]